MSEDVYFKLGERLNEYPVKILLVEPYLNILREFYSEKQAAIGGVFPLGGHTAAEAAKKLNRDEKETLDLLEAMADNGTMFVTKTDDGVLKYALTPFVPGVIEFQLMRGTDTPKDRRFAKKLEEFMEGEMADIMKEVIKDEKVMKELIPSPPARIVTVEKELPKTAEIYPYEEVTKLVEQEDSFAAAICYCRHHAYLIDKPCKVENVPEYSCLLFGKVADYIVDRKFGKRITKEEALQIIKQTEDAGLVHNTNNFIDSTVFVCNCCGCCCGFLKGVKETQNKIMLAISNFELNIDEDSCSGCGDCIERCQMDALSLQNEVIEVNAGTCIGCGNCVTVCPTESLSMVRRVTEEPPEAGDSMTAMGI